jgi:meso-butanediol dehydrogenase/(S,S)-butanediol dehydrogenase/diacetyl reductase
MKKEKPTMGKFSGQVAVVTGGGHGIGRASALRLAEDGADVAVLDINGPMAESVASECRERGVSARPYTVDVTSPEGVATTIASVLNDFGAIDILHVNAGRLRAGTILETDLEEWNRTLTVNVTGMFLVIKAAAPAMVARQRGAIVTTGSISGMFGEPALLAYTASKAAIVNMTRSLAIDFARDGIRVNCVCPGWVDTGFNNPQFEHDNLTEAQIEEQIQRTVPMGRQGLPEEMASVVSFLASEDASYITGQTLLVDGGLLSHV